MVDRPLYKDADIPGMPPSCNAGLWYDKFCEWKDISTTRPRIEKQKWISAICNNPCGNHDELQLQSERLQNMIECLNGRYIDLQTAGPFVTGLGRNHPVENGFLWHHTLGVPYLPGTSVKGMVSAWAKQWEREQELVWESILGAQQQVGDTIFFDVLPTKPVQLVTDVMTPHYGEYYQNVKPPGDWIDPNPIPFLAVGSGATFRFAVAPRRPSEIDHSHCETACRWLIDALNWIGAGAKTAIGYGRFEETQPAAPHPLEKDMAIEATLYLDKKNRWCGRTADGRSGTIFGEKPDDALADEKYTLYVRVPPPQLQFTWTIKKK